MGAYLNPSNRGFEQLVNTKLMVDKSLLIEKTNSIINTSFCYLCVSRPRRFGKSCDANMLVAYYSKGCDSYPLFKNLKIADELMFKEHLNKHNVIHLDMTSFISQGKSIDYSINLISGLLIREMKEQYPNVDFFDEHNLQLCLMDVYYQSKEGFIFIIDEWDCLFREDRENLKKQKDYLDFLRTLFKDKPYVEMVYMTGILPIKKYGSHSALNMFDEVSMTSADDYARFMGFCEEDVRLLCEKFNMDFNMMQTWYDGYHLSYDISIYSPRSVTAAIRLKKYRNYWSQSETFEALKEYIDLNFDGMKDDVMAMIVGEKRHVNITTFQNDMTSFSSKDDVFTLLVHLGYLSYDEVNSCVSIPNNEVKDTFVDSIRQSNWGKISKMFKDARDLLVATWNMDSVKVAKYIQESHYETSILQYNDENALSYTVSLAYIAAREYYTIVREMPAGKGFADIAFIPKSDKPAMLVELKYDKTVDSAISQIKQKQYPKGLLHYLDNLLLVSISYDKATKEHTCYIEKYQADSN